MRDLTGGNLSKTFLRFAVPTLLAGLLSQSYSLINSISFGQFLGIAGLAAIGASGGLLSVFEALFWCFGTGCGVYVAKLFGAGRFLELRNTVLASLLVESVVAILLGIGATVFCDPILTLLRVDPTVRTEAAIYFRIYAGGLAFINVTSFGMYITHALGISAFPLYMSVLACVMNIGGSLLSVTALDFGIAGVAASTVLASAAVTACYLFKFRSLFREMNVKGAFRMRGYFKHTLPYALPSMIQQTTMYFASAAVSPLINGIGASASAAYAVVHKVYSFTSSMYQSTTKVLANFIAQCAGSRSYRRIRDGIPIVLRQAACVAVPILAVCAVFPDTVCSLFFDRNATADSIAYAVLFLRYFLPFVLFNLVNNIFHAILKGIKSMNLLMLSTAINTAVFVLGAYLAAPALGIRGIYAAWVCSWIAEAIFAICIYYSGLWQPRDMKTALRENSDKG